MTSLLQQRSQMTLAAYQSCCSVTADIVAQEKRTYNSPCSSLILLTGEPSGWQGNQQVLPPLSKSRQNKLAVLLDFTFKHFISPVHALHALFGKQVLFCD
jgi:hypothetical protein